MIVLLILLAGCVTGPGESTLPEGDPDVFAADVQPILAARCGNPACHGTAERPLEVYGVGLHRIDPADLFLETPLSDEEKYRNLTAAEAFLAGFAAAADSPLLTKPLSPDSGGSEHTGGVQWADPTESEYLTLLDWGDDALIGAHP